MRWVGMPSTPGEARLLMLVTALIISLAVKGVFNAIAAFFLSITVLLDLHVMPATLSGRRRS